MRRIIFLMTLIIAFTGCNFMTTISDNGLSGFSGSATPVTITPGNLSTVASAEILAVTLASALTQPSPATITAVSLVSEGVPPAPPVASAGGAGSLVVTCTASQPQGWIAYRVKAGDTVQRLATATNTLVSQIVSVNCLVRPDMIRAGQILYLPLPVPEPLPAPTNALNSCYHVVNDDTVVVQLNDNPIQPSKPPNGTYLLVTAYNAPPGYYHVTSPGVDGYINGRIINLVGDCSRFAGTVTCSINLPPRLLIGLQGRVTPGQANILRSQPSRDNETSNVIGQIAAGELFTTINGPVCGDKLTWWQVYYQGQTGWMAEGENGVYWSEPVPGLFGSYPLDCPASLPGRLTVGGRARVTPGAANIVRQTPGKSGAQFITIPGGATFDVAGGPFCRDGISWWGINYNGYVGWTAEGENGQYFVVPAP